jgi:PleD family two-component response regulator
LKLLFSIIVASWLILFSAYLGTYTAIQVAEASRHHTHFKHNNNNNFFSTSPSAVDDEADITFTLKKELEQTGFSLDVFNDPTTALSNFKAHYYGLILLDVKMPQMNYTKR